nr:hypothetical protein [Streptomyces sp. ADI95-17]
MAAERWHQKFPPPPELVLWAVRSRQNSRSAEHGASERSHGDTSDRQDQPPAVETRKRQPGQHRPQPIDSGQRVGRHRRRAQRPGPGRRRRTRTPDRPVRAGVSGGEDQDLAATLSRLRELTATGDLRIRAVLAVGHGEQALSKRWSTAAAVVFFANASFAPGRRDGGGAARRVRGGGIHRDHQRRGSGR